jgi:hypothetical protein
VQINHFLLSVEVVLCVHRISDLLDNWTMPEPEPVSNSAEADKAPENFPVVAIKNERFHSCIVMECLIFCYVKFIIFSVCHC